MTILLADDHPIIQSSLTYQLAGFLPQARVLVCSNFPQVLIQLEQQPVDLVVLDIDLPGSGNVQMMKLIRQKRDNVRILIYSGLDPKVYALPYIQSGADGYLSKLTPVSEFEVAIRSLLKNGTYFNEEIQQLWLSKLGQNLQHLTTNPLQSLSTREMTIVDLISEGKWIKEIADILNLKINTVSTYKKRIFDKLDVTNTKQLMQKVKIFKHL